jgi:hypothetical protein
MEAEGEAEGEADGLAEAETEGAGDRGDDVGAGDRPDTGSLGGGTGAALGPGCRELETEGTPGAERAGGDVIPCVGGGSLTCSFVPAVSTDGRTAPGVGPPVRPIATTRRNPPPRVVRATTQHMTHPRGEPEGPTKTGLRARCAERRRGGAPATGLSCSASMLTECASPPLVVRPGRFPGQSFPRQRRPRSTRYASAPRDDIGPRG